MVDLLPVASRFRSAVITLTVASASFDIWWFYNNVETRDLDAMNYFPTFFRYDSEAHFRNVVVGLYTLYDTYPGTNTIKSLLHSLDKVDTKPMWRKYKTIHLGVKKAKFLRSNLIAHRNAAESYDELFKRAGLTPDHLKGLISDSLTLLTMIADVINVDRPILSNSVVDDTRGLLARLKGA